MSKLKHNTKQCATLLSALSDYINDELDDEGRKIIDEHLKDCRPCQVCLSTLRRTVEICRQFKATPPPSGFSSRLRTFLQRLG